MLVEYINDSFHKTNNEAMRYKDDSRKCILHIQGEVPEGDLRR